MNRYKYILIALVIVLCTCTQSQNHIYSHDFHTSLDRINALKKCFVLRTEIFDTAFDIYDVNMNNRTIPGPTDRDYRIVLKMDSSYIREWIKDVQITSFPINYDWAKELLKENNFSIGSVSGIFTGPDKQVIVFQNDGIILFRIRQY